VPKAPLLRVRELSVDLKDLRASKAVEIAALPEVAQAGVFTSKLQHGGCANHPSTCNLTLEEVGMSEAELMNNVRAAFATNILHTESRIMSLLGQGFYTIGNNSCAASQQCVLFQVLTYVIFSRSKW
jgi:hypothetical protein